MIKNSIEQVGESIQKILVVDAEMLFNVTTKKIWYNPFKGKHKFPFEIERVFTFSDMHRKFLRVLKKIDKHYDDIIICTTKLDAKFVEHIVFDILSLNYRGINFADEETYKNFLKMKQPEFHIAVLPRVNYTKQSVLGDVEFFNSLLEEYEG